MEGIVATKCANTPDGFVVRQTYVDRESAWRKGLNGKIAVSHGSYGPWVIVEASTVPAEIIAAFALNGEPL
jgi:hypothetical protein